MKEILKRVADFNEQSLTYESLGAFVRSLKVDSIDYMSHLPELGTSAGYTRNILCLEPFELVLLHWPPNAESAVHLHEGFWGYVLCLDGEIENVTYTLKEGELLEGKGMRALPGGCIDEPDGVIHKIINPSSTERLVTLHFYYPALETLEGLKLYDLVNQRMAVLNAKAKTASFDQDESCFDVLVDGAFSYIPPARRKGLKSHRIFPVVPKPDSQRISELVGEYYKEQAEEYDFFDLKHPSRKRYNDQVNRMIALELAKVSNLDRVVDLACGTGRRAMEIRELSGCDYHLCGVDLSHEMVVQAQSRGMEARQGNWLDVEMPEHYADALTFLYAYGHIPTVAERMASLKKIHRSLKPGGLFFFDVFNQHDTNEWGPQALKAFDELKLGQHGYERGDVFYKKQGGQGIAFLHYCVEDELVDFLEEAGFEVEKVTHIGYVTDSGEVLNSEQGSMLIQAKRR